MRVLAHFLRAHRLGLSAAALLTAAALLSTPALAQRSDNRPGDFDYYALVLSWSPTHCAESEGSDDDMQCNRKDGRRYAFVLHGLWPQYEKGWPESCRTPGRPFVPDTTIDRMLDIMPSKSLVIHEFRKHGTCSGMTADQYFNLSRRLFQSIRIPEKYQNPFENQFVAPDELVDQILVRNPDLDEDMIAVSCRGAGNRLREVRICFSKDGRPRSCGGNENRGDLCRAAKMFVPPVRSTKSEPDSAEARQKAAPQHPLPMPRVIRMFQ